MDIELKTEKDEDYVKPCLPLMKYEEQVFPSDGNYNYISTIM